MVENAKTRLISVCVIAIIAASNAEKALATGVGTNNTPGLLTFEGRIDVNDIGIILGR